MKLGYIGLGKMGVNMVQRLLDKNHKVVVFDKNKDAVKKVSKLGAKPADSFKSLAKALPLPRLVWLMVPHGAVNSALKELMPFLQKGDTVIDGGNSNYKESMRRAMELQRRGINFLDAGISGGPSGARNGACIMVGGKKELFKKYEKLFKDLSVKNGYGYMGKPGAGHFVKMVHNGIEYGMMQALAEGFSLMKASDFDLDLEKIAWLYNHKSVIESRVTGWLKDAFEKYGRDLKKISGSADHSGECMWTVKEAKKLGIPVPVISEALNFRIKSQKNPSYAGQILSALRNQFGGHEVKPKRRIKGSRGAE
ncbi:MAG: decarboxylating 6-phosphogluconate dehydrogenase [Nitrospirae bacterium]|nr:decarboxylating 6-phosphogluconate dehydrogenase [Nitrospirota bacterium]